MFFITHANVQQIKKFKTYLVIIWSFLIALMVDNMGSSSDVKWILGSCLVWNHWDSHQSPGFDKFQWSHHTLFLFLYLFHIPRIPQPIHMVCGLFCRFRLNNRYRHNVACAGPVLKNEYVSQYSRFFLIIRLKPFKNAQRPITENHEIVRTRGPSQYKDVVLPE